MTWILFREVAPADEGYVWAVGYLDKRSGQITSITWYATEREARLAHHETVYPE